MEKVIIEVTVKGARRTLDLTPKQYERLQDLLEVAEQSADNDKDARLLELLNWTLPR